MTRFIFPIILVLISLGSFAWFTNPVYKDISDLKTRRAAYDEALTNSKELARVRDELVAKYNSFSASDLEHLRKLVPDNVDNIRLILEIERIASSHAMSLSNVKYNVLDQKKDAAAQAAVGGVPLSEQNKNFGTFDLQFSTKGDYATFLTFLSDIEHSLRLVDLSSLSVSVGDSLDQSKNIYSYDLSIQTYWLKN